MLRGRLFHFSILPLAAFLFFCQIAGIGVRSAMAKKAKPAVAQPKAAGSDNAPGQISTKSAVLEEVSTGTILFEQNGDEIIEPASFTKVLTLYLTFEALQQGLVHLNDEVLVSETAWRTGGSKMFVGVGSRVPLEELIKGVAVVSGNDACVAVAEHLHGSVDAFVDAMNRKASELGMKNSHFLNPHGLPADGQITTARDMATLATAYLQRFPEALRFHSMQEYSYNNISQHNRNRLLFKDPSVDGLKTGFVAAAGYHLTATAQRDGMRLLAVVMGAATPPIREREALKLLNFGFRHYAMVQPFPLGQPLATVKVWKGVKDSLGLYPTEAASFLIPQTQKNALRWEVSAQTEVTAPVQARQPLGEVVFYVSGEPKKSVTLASREDVARAGWFKVVWQSVVRVDRIDWRWLVGIAGGIVLVVGLFLLIANRGVSSKRFKPF
jgi:serine-type D-Ala-D-Ala carboxypeptidase (penicillin-binding protein 5/6)